MEDWELLRIEYFDNYKFLVYINSQGEIKKERVTNFIYNEEKINIFNEDIKQEWEIEV